MSLDRIRSLLRRRTGQIILFSGLVTLGVMAVRTGSCPACAVLGTLADLLSPTSARAEATPASVAAIWSFVDLDGKRIDANAYRGKVVIVDFWATWCAPCRKEIPGFVALQKKYGDKGLVIIGASLDRGDDKVVKDFAKEFSVNYPLVRPKKGDIPAVFGSFDSIPTTFVFDRNGQLKSTHTGFTSPEVFEREVLPLLEAAAPGS